MQASIPFCEGGDGYASTKGTGPSVPPASAATFADRPPGLGWAAMTSRPLLEPKRGARTLPGTDTSGSPRARPTIMDVARTAGVSRGTVSRVLNGGKNVRPAVAQHVRAVIDELHYSVNEAARNLRTGSTRTVAYVIFQRHEHLFDDPNFGGMVRLLAQHLQSQDRHLLIATAQDKDEETFLGDYLNAGHVDGALLAQPPEDDLLLERMARAQLPLVVLGRPMGWEQSFSWVSIGNSDAAFEATRYLKRHRRAPLASITGPLNTSSARARLEGFRRAMGRAFQPELVAQGDWSLLSGQLAAERILDRCPGLGGLFVASDLMAVGAVRALQAAGKKVPDDIAVFGFDDSAAAMMTEPPLTTWRNPLDQFAFEAVRILDQLIQAPAQVPSHVVLRGELVVRGSA